MNPRLICGVAKAFFKAKLSIGALTGVERYLLSQVSLPDRVPVSLAATNVEPYLVDPRYDYKLLTSSPEANLDLFAKIKRRFDFDAVFVPVWMGLLTVGAAELGTRFRIEDRRAPYAVEYPIKGMEDLARIEIPREPGGYLKMYFDVNKEAQRRFPDTMVFPVFDGPWDLAMLLRGDHHLPIDFRLYKDYRETEDAARREKIARHGDPHLWPAIMELSTRLCIRHVQLGKDTGMDMTGAALVDQYAAEPMLGTRDFLTYVLPYIERVWKAHGRKLTLAYMVTSPRRLERLLEHPVLGPGLGQAGLTNYIFPQTADGVTLTEYDPPMLELARKRKKTYNYVVHGKFLRDATGEELENLVKRICSLATHAKARLTLTLGAIPPGCDLRKVDRLLSLVKTYGKYEHAR